MRIIETAAVIIAASACSNHFRGPYDEVQEVSQTFKANANPDLDILFVVDDSKSMTDKQQALSDALMRSFVAQLRSSPEGPPNLHFGVVSSDMGTTGSASGPAPDVGAGPDGACSGSGKAGVLQDVSAVLTSGNFLVDSRDGTRNYAGDLADTMSAMLRLGDGGCGFEQHLSAMRAALDANPMNAGFLRPSANLAVFVIADEDDCSMIDSAMLDDDPSLGPLTSYRCFANGVACNEGTAFGGKKTGCVPYAQSHYVEDPDTFRSFLLGLKGNDARKVTFGAVAGGTVPINVEASNAQALSVGYKCDVTNPSGSTASPAVRLTALARSFAAHPEFEGGPNLGSICSASLDEPLGQLGGVAKQVSGDTCVTAAIAPTNARGDKDVCTLTDVRDSAPDAQTTLSECAPGQTTDCFDIVDDLRCDGTSKLDVHRSTPAADDTWSTLHCSLHYTLL